MLGELRTASLFLTDPDDPAYGLTPLHFAPDPASRWRSAFASDEIDAHLLRLERDQGDDGGWPLAWSPPSDASRLEWRGRQTLAALRVLASYGRIDPGGSSAPE